MNSRYLLIIGFVFLGLCGIFYWLRMAYPAFSTGLLFGANVLMAVLSIGSYLIVKKTLGERPQAFVRGVYGATFLKLLVCLVGILTYVMLNRQNIHKPSLFILFGIYIVYTTVETWMLSKMARKI